MIQRIFSFFKTVHWSRVFGYMGLFFFFFFIFLYATFPYDGIKNSIVSRIEAEYPVKVRIGKLTPFRFTGIKVSNIKVTKYDDPENVLFQVDKGLMRMHILPLLVGKLKADVDLYFFGGGISGQVVWKGAQLGIAANIKDIDLARAGADQQLKNYGEIRIQGTLDGHTELYFNNLEKTENHGMVRLEYRNLRVVNSTLLGNKLPDMVFKDPAVIQMSLSNRFFKIDEWTLSSENLDVKASGRITLREKFDNSRFNINFSIKPSEAVEDSLGTFAMVLPEPDDSGYYNFAVTGTPKNPSFKKR